MKKEFKPTGYNSVSPYFIVSGAERMLDLLKKVFNAKELRKYTNTDGSIMHIELQIEDSVIMMGEASEKFPANQLTLHVYVPDSNEVFNKAIAAGCESIEKPSNRPGDPDMRGTFKDFAGNYWSVGTQM
jgi:PhnB protein